jgi:hypothetical protein
MTTAPPTDPTAAGDLPPFVLPPSKGTRARRLRDERRRRLRRRLQWVGGATAVAVVVVIGAAALLRSGGDPNGKDKGTGVVRSDRATGTTAVAASPATRGTARTLLLVQQNPDGSASSLTVLATTGDGGTMLFVPPGAMTEVPSFGLEAVGGTATMGGPSLLQATVENLLGVEIDHMAVADDAALANMVRPVGDLRVDLTDRVEQVAPDGTVQVAFEAGPNLLGPEDVGRLLAVKGEGNDLARLARQQSFWRAWLAALRRKPSALPAAGGDGGLRPFLSAMTKKPVEMDLLPVEAVDAGGDRELYRVRQDAVEVLVRRSLPGGSSLAQRTRVQVLNGTGAVGLAQQVTVRLVQPPLRARVQYTGNADAFDHDTTEIVFYDRRMQAAADAVRKALGIGRLVLSRRPTDVVDVTVVVGRDFK